MYIGTYRHHVYMYYRHHAYAYVLKYMVVVCSFWLFSVSSALALTPRALLGHSYDN